ncbi:DegV family protein [Janibacter cremeus]|uniref:DegV family protein with EDD domain n=1 Tax=Janibacter cremeus TaxID=1285192 RepID=A0A852VNP4_9MICO|nr:DegV family protein with EDD domain [Janibacter cremeus]
MNIAVVTDSTASLTQDHRDQHGIAVIPLHVVIDGVDRPEGEGADTQWVEDALRAKADISTSRPTPATFLQAYQQAAKGGAEAIISVHLSGLLSGTVDSARSAAPESPVPVHVVDSRLIGMGLGFAAIGAARDARAGRDVEDVVERLERRCAASSVRLVVHSLDRLRRGGRIGGARALLGSALAMKPLLHVVDGEVQPLERVRTAGKAIARLQALTEAECAQLPDWADGVDVAVHHIDAAERAELLSQNLAEHIDGDVDLAAISAVVAAHVGLGLVGVAVSPRPRD